MSKADLMRKFKIAVTVYMFAFVAAFFIPVYDSTGKDTRTALIIEVIWNTILLGLLLVLAWVFRPREEQNPYLFVGEDEAQNVHLDTRVRCTSPLFHVSLHSCAQGPRFFVCVRPVNAHLVPHTPYCAVDAAGSMMPHRRVQSVAFAIDGYLIAERLTLVHVRAAVVCTTSVQP